MALSKLEIRRRIFHLVNGFIIVGLIYIDILTGTGHLVFEEQIEKGNIVVHNK